MAQFVQVLSVSNSGLITFLVRGKEYTYFLDMAILRQLMQKYMKYKPGTLFNEVKRLGVEMT